jgi:hypothetical protein
MLGMGLRSGRRVPVDLPREPAEPGVQGQEFEFCPSKCRIFELSLLESHPIKSCDPLLQRQLCFGRFKRLLKF